jgi:integrase
MIMAAINKMIATGIPNVRQRKIANGDTAYYIREGDSFVLAGTKSDGMTPTKALLLREGLTGGRESDWVGISEHLVDLLRDQKRETGFKEYVFISPKTDTKFYNRPKFFAGLAKRAGIKRFTAHGIRHLSASEMYYGGAPVAYIQMRLRHTSPTTTDRYLHGFKGTAQSDILANASAQLLGLSRQANKVQAQAQAHAE